MAASHSPARVHIDVVSDVVCPWCYIGKRRIENALKLVPDLAVETIESSCCGMAGSFGYNAETIDVSLAMGELSLLPAVRKANPDAIIVADGTSCRHQIADGADRNALHVAQVLAMSLDRASSSATSPLHREPAHG